jgi:hypothetical protein
VVCSRVHALQEALSAATIALEISSRNSRVAALQESLGPAARRPGSDHRPAGGGHGRFAGRGSGLLGRDCKGKKADRLAYKVDTGLLAELRGPERQAAGEL